MKKLFFFLLLLPIISFAQVDWHPVPDNQVSYYEYGNYCFHVYTMKIDSVITVDSDQFYYNIKNPELVVGFEEYAFYDPFSSWIGKEIFINDNVARFYNNQGQESVINFTRSSNEPWLYYTEENGSYIEAHVESLDFIPILEGLNDSVKYITFDFFNKHGQRIAKSSYNDTLVLAKNYGLVKTPRFNTFSFASSSFNELIGIEHNDEFYGWEYHFNEYVVNYQIGDEIHNTNGDDDFIEVIIDIEQDEFIIDYEIQKCTSDGEIEFFIRRFYKNIYPGQSVFVPENSGKHGRHKVYYLPTSWQGFPQHIFQFYYEYSNSEYEGQYVWRKYYDQGGTGIYPPLLACNELNVSIYERGADEQWYIQFFQNETYSYGTPYAFNCVVASIENESKSFSISPNPNKGVFKLSNPFNQNIKGLQLINMHGEIVWRTERWNKNEIVIQDQVSGIYILQILYENGDSVKERFVIQN